MPTIAMIGAGSLVFCKTLVSDILATPALARCEIRLMNRTRPKLDAMERFVRRLILDNRLPATVSAMTDRREALRGAEFVICMVQVGGLTAFGHDYEIPRRYGVDQCIGDSLGPGGVLRGLRHIHFLQALAEDMRELCPDALLINYANPMAACMVGLGQMGAPRAIGLCHGVQTTLDLIARYVDLPKDRIEYECAGINHMAWFLALREVGTGRDLYPLFKANCEKPEYYVNEKVRIEVMRHFGYFMTESTGHLSEYVPWFRKTDKALAAYCDQPDFGGVSGAYYKYAKAVVGKYDGVDYLAAESSQLPKRSVEYCSYILEAVETDRPFRLHGNVVNHGYITNLPDGACVEVPVFVDSRGLHPAFVGDLPIQCAALNMSNVQVQLLVARAALTGDPELAMQAIAMDPLAGAVCTLDEIRRMTAELLEAEREWLPQFEGRTLAPRPFISVPRDMKGVEVPLDPALATANRFGELAQSRLPKGAAARVSPGSTA
jgi:alpha-galactosidase